MDSQMVSGQYLPAEIHTKRCVCVCLFVHACVRACACVCARVRLCKFQPTTNKQHGVWTERDSCVNDESGSPPCLATCGFERADQRASVPIQ